MNAARGQDPVHLLTLTLGNLCNAPSSALRGNQGTTEPAEVTCHACLNVALRGLVADMLGVMSPGPTAEGFAVTAGILGVKGADGRPLTGGYDGSEVAP